MTGRTLSICDWCKEPIQPGAPKVQTATVDVDFAYQPRGVPVASNIRNYHIDRDCYRQSRYQNHLAASKAPTLRREPMSKERISEDAYTWGEAFGLTAEQALTGQGERRRKRRRRIRRAAR